MTTNQTQREEQEIEDLLQSFWHDHTIVPKLVSYQRPAHPRYVAFPSGAITELPLTRAGLDWLRKERPKTFDSALDVTPGAGRLAVHVALGLNAWWPSTSTNFRLFACPTCADGAHAWMICDECGGTRKVLRYALIQRIGDSRRDLRHP